MIKFILLLAAICLTGTAVFPQVSSLSFNDTRNVSYPPDSFRFETRFEFKDRIALGFPGTDNWAGLMTVSPWSDASGGNVYQLNFNHGGLFYRQGTRGTGWHQWQQILTDKAPVTISTPSDVPLTLYDEKSSGWQYMQFLRSTGRMAYMGITPSNEFIIEKEMGGNIILAGGNVGIGTSTPGSYKLAVEGTIGARRVKVTSLAWADFVFDDDYQLMPLPKVAQFIAAHKHLPDIPSAANVEQEGIDLGDMNARLLQKIEELTLYLIEHRKELDALKADNKALKEAISKMKQ